MSSVAGLLMIGQPLRAPSAMRVEVVRPDDAASVSSIDPAVPVDAARYDAIVLHASGSDAGTPGELDRLHRSEGLEGLGFHFVVGNGNGLGDGVLHRSLRWERQSAGAHVAAIGSDRSLADDWNRRSIGICLIGNGERTGFTPQQLAQLVDLVRELQRRYAIPASEVRLHSDLAPVDSPGPMFPVGWFEAQLD